jgi:hypothetical protein
MADMRELLSAYLREEGYVPTPEGDRGILFKREGRTYFTFPDPGDPSFFNLYSYFDFADRVTGRAQALEAANDINQAIKALKVTLPDGSRVGQVSFGLEIPLPEPEGFRAVFDRALGTIAYGVEQFVARLDARRAA